jgi:hypothetical protein
VTSSKPEAEWKTRRVQFGEGHATLVMTLNVFEFITSVAMAWRIFLLNEEAEHRLTWCVSLDENNFGCRAKQSSHEMRSAQALLKNS